MTQHTIDLIRTIDKAILNIFFLSATSIPIGVCLNLLSNKFEFTTNKLDGNEELTKEFCMCWIVAFILFNTLFYLFKVQYLVVYVLIALFTAFYVSTLISNFYERYIKYLLLKIIKYWLYYFLFTSFKIFFL